jgi:hypothetical protein
MMPQAKNHRWNQEAKQKPPRAMEKFSEDSPGVAESEVQAKGRCRQSK